MTKNFKNYVINNLNGDQTQKKDRSGAGSHHRHHHFFYSIQDRMKTKIVRMKNAVLAVSRVLLNYVYSYQAFTRHRATYYENLWKF